MESELWYLVLIPVLFAAGWWARGLDAGERERNSRRLPEAYSRGVAMLMSDRPDKAIDPFIEVVRLDPELIELRRAGLHGGHIGLGAHDDPDERLLCGLCQRNNLLKTALHRSF